MRRLKPAKSFPALEEPLGPQGAKRSGTLNEWGATSPQLNIQSGVLAPCVRTPSVTAEFQSLHPVLAFPPSLRVRSQRSAKQTWYGEVQVGRTA